MRLSNFDYELADRRAEEERSTMIARAQAALKPNTVSECQHCGEAISEARKRAMPSARFCIDCAQKRERN